MEEIYRRSTNPETQTNSEYALLFNFMSFLKKFVDTVVDVVITDISEDGKYVDCKSIPAERTENGSDLPQQIFNNIPVCSFLCAAGSLRFRVGIGDCGILIARKYDIPMPDPLEGVPQRTQIESGRLMSFAQGFFIPISFCGNPEVDFELQSGSTSVKIDTNGLNVIVNGDATVKATKAVIESSEVFLGGESGALAVARNGDSVVSGGSVIGTIQSSSEVVKSL